MLDGSDGSPKLELSERLLPYTATFTSLILETASAISTRKVVLDTIIAQLHPQLNGQLSPALKWRAYLVTKFLTLSIGL